ncbi:MAG: hypothetical protein LQ339_003967 [Xanthoria mediterranea]|nr:MAG: hypothetical protein LQ339_003967 [Xanthoria mediterranea]
MPTLGDLRVIISVDKQNQTDYHDEDTAGQDAKFISRYVECKSGASFSVDISIKKTMNFKSDAIVFYVYVDGHQANGVIIAKADVSTTSGAVYFHRISGATRKIADKWKFRPFMFVEQVSGLIAKQYDRKKLGSIEVKACHITQRDFNPGKNSSWEEAKSSSEVALSEKQLKGSSATHSTNYGKTQSCAEHRICNFDYVDGKTFPFAYFQFKYRSKAEQHVKREGEIKRTAGLESEQEVKPETGVKRERDEEMEEILASAYVKRPKNTAPVDLTDV